MHDRNGCRGSWKMANLIQKKDILLIFAWVILGPFDGMIVSNMSEIIICSKWIENFKGTDTTVCLGDLTKVNLMLPANRYAKHVFNLSIVTDRSPWGNKFTITDLMVFVKQLNRPFLCHVGSWIRLLFSLIYVAASLPSDQHNTELVLCWSEGEVVYR